MERCCKGVKQERTGLARIRLSENCQADEPYRFHHESKGRSVLTGERNSESKRKQRKQEITLSSCFWLVIFAVKKQRRVNS